MQSVRDILAAITAILGVTPNDTILMLTFVVAFGILIAMGLETIYQVLFGASLGLGIYILLSILFSASSWTEASFIIPSVIASAIVGSSVYLPFLLAVLIPLNHAVRFPVGSNVVMRVIGTLLLSAVTIAFFVALFTGLSERVGIFNRENLFSLIHTGKWYDWYALTYTHGYAIRWMQLAIVAGVLTIIYRLMLQEIVTSITVSIVANIMKKRSGWSGGHAHIEESHDLHDDGWHDDHDDHHGHH